MEDFREEIVPKNTLLWLILLGATIILGVVLVGAYSQELRMEAILQEIQVLKDCSGCSAK